MNHGARLEQRIAEDKARAAGADDKRYPDPPPTRRDRQPNDKLPRPQPK